MNLPGKWNLDHTTVFLSYVFKKKKMKCTTSEEVEVHTSIDAIDEAHYIQ